MNRRPFAILIGLTTAFLLWFAVSRGPTITDSFPSPISEASGARSDDPHDWPEWTRFRREWIKSHPNCEWTGCKASGPGMNVHHGISARWCVLSGHPELVYTNAKGQWFLTLCRDHHELAHDICDKCGGSWQKFNPDSKADAKAGKWNSRGKSAWTFETDREAVAWIKGRVERDE